MPVLILKDESAVMTRDVFRLSDTDVWEKCRLTGQMEDEKRLGNSKGGSHPDK